MARGEGIDGSGLVGRGRFETCPYVRQFAGAGRSVARDCPGRPLGIATMGPLCLRFMEGTMVVVEGVAFDTA